MQETTNADWWIGLSGMVMNREWIEGTGDIPANAVSSRLLSMIVSCLWLIIQLDILQHGLPEVFSTGVFLQHGLTGFLWTLPQDETPAFFCFLAAHAQVIKLDALKPANVTTIKIIRISCKQVLFVIIAVKGTTGRSLCSPKSKYSTKNTTTQDIQYRQVALQALNYSMLSEWLQT